MDLYQVILSSDMSVCPLVSSRYDVHICTTGHFGVEFDLSYMRVSIHPCLQASLTLPALIKHCIHLDPVIFIRMMSNLMSLEGINIICHPSWCKGAKERIDRSKKANPC